MFYAFKNTLQLISKEDQFWIRLAIYILLYLKNTFKEHQNLLAERRS